MSKCKKYDASIISDYIENNLDNAELTEFVKHLLECEICSDAVINAKKELEIMNKLSFIPIPEEIKSKGMIYASSIHPSYASFGDIVFQSMGNIVNLIKDTFSIQEPLVQTIGFRNSTHKESSTTLTGKTFKIDVIALLDNKVELVITLNKSAHEQNKNISLYKIHEERIKLISSFRTENFSLIISDIEYGKYILEIDDNQLHFSLISPNNIN